MFHAGANRVDPVAFSAQLEYQSVGQDRLRITCEEETRPPCTSALAVVEGR